VRSQVCEILNQALADCSDLAMQSKTAHWNVKGPHFIGLHKLFDELYEEVGEHVDTIAERIAALGGTVKGRLQDAHDNTRLKPYPMTVSDGMAHVRALADSYANFANEIRSDIDKCEDLEDKVTGDILNAITAAIDKNLWFLEAHLRS
jgi:starvation-inducible DNA-binding protein